MVAMNDLIVYRRNRWFMGLLLSPMTRRITFFHLLVLLLPAVGAFWLLQLHPDDRDVKLTRFFDVAARAARRANRAKHFNATRGRYPLVPCFSAERVRHGEPGIPHKD